MGAYSRCFLLPFAALVLVVTPLRAQDGGPVGQPPFEMLPAGEACCQDPCVPSFRFQADWLFTTNVRTSCPTPNFVNGPDATSFDDLPDFTGDSGYRLRGGVTLGNWTFECVYSHFGDWESSLNRNVNGVAFNANAAGGNWSGLNSINGGTYFSPIYNAASLTSSATNTAGDQSGLGPNNLVSTDPRPALMAYSHSDFYMTEANVKGADCLFSLFGHGFRLGAGYVNANFNNDSWVGLSGTFRISNGTAATVSLPGSVLTSYPGGNLVLYSGGGSGFTDGVSNGGTAGVGSQLFFTHRAQTRNSLNGVQLALDGDLLEYHRLEIGASLKAGIFDNFAQGTITETYGETNYDQSVFARQFSASCHHLAFLGGLGIDAQYHVTDEITVGVGYEVLYLSNLALGPEQINGVSNSWYHVQTDGTALIQSLHTGLEIAF